MKALTVVSNQNLQLLEVDKPNINENEVLVKVAYCGVCGSDLPRYYNNGVHQYPQVLGHEFSGVISEIGEKVNDLSVGDRVAVAPLLPCNECADCKKGEPALCTNYSFIGSRQQGAMAEYVAVPSINCIKVPDEIDLEIAALIEPLTVAIHGVDRYPLKTGASTMVIGAGTIGLLTIAVLKAKGAGNIITVDINQDKLNMAKALGADVCINTTETSLESYFNDNELPEYVYETAGVPETQLDSIKYVKKKGKVVYIGTATGNVNFEPAVFEKILRGELEITGSWMSYSSPFPGYEWDAALSLISKSDLDLKQLITGVYSLEDLAAPFDEMTKKGSKAIKVLYKISE